MKKEHEAHKQLSQEVSNHQRDQFLSQSSIGIDYADNELSQLDFDRKRPSRIVTTACDSQDVPSTQNKSLHPATPSFIKFEFDADGQYSSDGTKYQQEVMNYLMLGAQRMSQ